MRSQTWVHPKSLCLLTIWFCAVLVTADGGDQHFEDRIYTLTRTVKQQLNALADMEKVQPQSNSFEPPQDDHTAQDNYINERLKKIEQIIAELKNSNSTDVKDRVNDLEAALESIQKSMDDKQKNNAEIQNRLEDALLKATDLLNKLTRRIAKLEEPKLNELKKHLEKRDYVNAALSADAIIDEMEFLDVVRNVFTMEVLEVKDVDFLLLFGENVSNLKFRFLIYEFIKDKLMARPKSVDTLGTGYLYFKICNKLKLYQKVDTKLLKVPHSSSDPQDDERKLSNDLRAALMTTTYIDDVRYQLSNNLIGNSKSWKSSVILNDSALILEEHDDDSKTLEYGFKLDENLNCWVNLNANLINRESIAKIFHVKGATNGIGNLRPMNSVQSALYQTLKSKNYKDAVAKYESIRDDDRSIDTVIHNVYNELHDIDSLFAFISLVQREDSRRKLYLAVYDAIDQTDLTNVCDLLKVFDKLPGIHSKNDLKIFDSILSYLKNSPRRMLTQDAADRISGVIIIGRTEFNQITIYSKFDNAILAKLKVYTVDHGNNTYCYYQGGVSLSNYDSWYTGLKKKFGYAPFSWAIFIWSVTSVCIHW